MWPKNRNSKFGNQKQTVDGHSYDSKMEASVASQLELRKKAGDIKEWERQYKVELYGENGSKICNYYVDFVVTHNDDRLEFIEVKGFETAIWKLKWKMFQDKFGKDFTKVLTVLRKEDI